MRKDWKFRAFKSRKRIEYRQMSESDTKRVKATASVLSLALIVMIAATHLLM